MSEAFGTWQLEAVLAVGGLGEIWRAVREGEVAAVKRLHSHLIRNAHVLNLFTLEQSLACELPRHPNVVHAIEAGTVAGRPYLALELAPGEDLRRMLAPPVRSEAGQPVPRAILPRARVRAIAIAACDAADHLHRHGFVHGDINPGNLVVSDADHVTLVDLGIARELGRGGATRGTHAYMAPEQVRGEPWTAATDVFALGVVLWELVAGTRLFHRGPPWLSQAAVVEAPAPPLDDPAMDAIAQAALIKDPAKRLASAAQLADRLRAL
jgi:serine/threonine protein kinase